MAASIVAKVVLVGLASWYSTEECHDPTASGEALDDTKLTAACWFVPFGSKVKVTRLGEDDEELGSIIVRVNDRGPSFKLVKEGRVIDLSKAAFGRLANLDKGIIKVRVELVELPKKKEKSK